MTEKTDSKSGAMLHWQRISFLLVIYDVLTIVISYGAALFLRYDFVYSAIPKDIKEAYAASVLILTAISLGIYALFHLYRSVWRFASFRELVFTGLASLCCLAVNVLGTILFFRTMPVSYYLIGWLLQFCFAITARFSYRLLQLLRRYRRGEGGNRIMIVGAGDAGRLLMRDVMQHNPADKVVCLIDDNPNKRGRYIDGVRIIGGRDEILSAVKEYSVTHIYVAIPTATAEQRRDIMQICSEAGCELRNLPGMQQLASGEVRVSDLHEVAIEDLLGREQVKTDLNSVFNFLTGRTILVTGGGGSIGSELCRQIASHRPKRLIIFDIYENNAYDIQLELREKYPQLDLVTLIGSVRDSRRLDQVFSEYRPDVVYHAAAHKHVPLMEDSPCEAIKNNAAGTYKTALAALKYGCSRFVLISTDKAVNPTNVMGATKRLCEMIVQTFDRLRREGRLGEIPVLSGHEEARPADLPADAKTEFVAVRFGNVLGSNGSVIPIFRRQIAKGGPVTVTHPDIIRYFMTISEAVSLVLLAGTYAKGGEIFVLDMGEPVKIDTLARNLIRLSGLKPDVDIKIVYTGLRPGEKLYEEKLMAEEGMRRTDNDLIHIGSPIPMDETEFLSEFRGLFRAAMAADPQIHEKLKKVVPTYSGQ